jgi:hypothetical protein
MLLKFISYGCSIVASMYKSSVLDWSTVCYFYFLLGSLNMAMENFTTRWLLRSSRVFFNKTVAEKWTMFASWLRISARHDSIMFILVILSHWVLDVKCPHITYFTRTCKSLQLLFFYVEVVSNSLACFSFATCHLGTLFLTFLPSYFLCCFKVLCLLAVMDNYKNVPQFLYGLSPSQMEMFMTDGNPYNRQSTKVTEVSYLMQSSVYLSFCSAAVILQS